MDLTSEKKKLRKHIKEIKNSFSKEELDRQSLLIQEKLMSLPEFQRTEHILLYKALPDEVDTNLILKQWHKKKHLYLPVIKGDDLEIVPFEGEDKMGPEKKYGILEPTGKKLEDEGLIELVIVPGVAFDKQNNRLGRGKGYYDRILKRLPNAWKTGLAFGFQVLNNLPAEPHDIKMDEIISAD